MPCQQVNVGGAAAIVCSRGRRRRPRCTVCNAPNAELLCDFVIAGRSTTCDAALCHGCAVEVGPNEHHCPHHGGPSWEAA